MDLEQRAKRQSVKIIISEICMVVAVILTVTILALIVSGYWVNSDFKVERQGMLQISSIPTGASVEVDGDAPWYQRTNTSKVLSSGEHEIKLTKDGYDFWSRTVNIREGLLFRVHYPRLFLLERKTTPAYELPAAASVATVSPDRSKLLVLSNTTKWQLFDLENETLKPTILDISKVFSSVSQAADADTGLFTGKIASMNWDNNNDHILIENNYDSSTEWVLLDVRNPANSVNISSDFAANFDEIRIFDNSASNLLALRGKNLHKIDVGNRQVSAILLENVESYDYYGNEIAFVAAKSSARLAEETTEGKPAPDKYYIGTLKIGDNAPISLSSLAQPAQIFISRFYDDKYLTLVSENNVNVYKKDDFSNVLSKTVNFKPEKVKIGSDGEFVTMSEGTNIAALDMESLEITEWQIASGHFGWLDGGMMYSVSGGELTVYDFDGQNRRTLSKNVSDHFPVTITSDKWLYYVSDGKIIREQIVE